MIEYKFKYGKEEKSALAERYLESDYVKTQVRVLGKLFLAIGSGALMLAFITFGAGANVAAIIWAVIAAFSYYMVCGGLKKLDRRKFLAGMDENWVVNSGETAYKFEEDLVSITTALGKNEMPWTSLENYGSVNHYLWIRVKGDSYLLIDRNKMPKEDMIELNGYLTKYLPKQ